MVSIQTNNVLPYCWSSLFCQYELLPWKHTDVGRWFTEMQQSRKPQQSLCLEILCSGKHFLLGTGGKQHPCSRSFNNMTRSSWLYPCVLLFPLVTVFSHYWCRALPPVKLSSCICSVLVREICPSFGTPSASSSNRGFPAEPCSRALVLLYTSSCQGWDVFPFLLLRFWKFAMKKWQKLSNGTWCRCRIFNLDSQIWINIKYSHSLHHIYPVTIFTFSRISL